MIILHPEDCAYPEKLRGLPQAPKTLYLEGDASVFGRPAVAIVGSRSATAYGLRAAEKFGERAAACGVTLVSGLARGIDSRAQTAALRAGGRVIAVLAGGFDYCYPPENRRLLRDICVRGAAVTEQAPDVKPRPYYFAYRNRIISGLADAVVIVEAGFSSGALITAEYAVDQGKALFAVPGSIFSRMSVGTNKLIQDSADIVTRIDDPFERIGAGAPAAVKYAALGEDERMVVEAVQKNGELTLEQLCAFTRWSPQRLGQIVTILEMKGVLVTCMGRIFAVDSANTM